MAEKLDVRKSLDSYRAPHGSFRVLEVPALQYLMIDGHGDPNTSPRYTEALQALYPLAYALKFRSKRELGRDYVVPPLEGLWWAEDMDAFTVSRDKTQWDWTMMLLVPDWLGGEDVQAALEKAGARKRPERLEDVRLGSLAEGLCVQTLHRGPFEDEGPVLERLHGAFLPEHGLRAQGTHHEIYLSDARRVAPEKLCTVLRQPVRSLAAQ